MTGANIPEARGALLAIAEELAASGKRDVAQKIRDVVDAKMIRRPPIRPRAPQSSKIVTAEMAEEIRRFAYANPKMPLQQVADRFGVNAGCVSEALEGSR